MDPMEWIKELSGSALMLVAVLAMLKFLQGERKDRSVSQKICHESHAGLQKKSEEAAEKTGVIIESNTRMLGRIDRSMSQREAAGN